MRLVGTGPLDHREPAPTQRLASSSTRASRSGKHRLMSLVGNPRHSARKRVPPATRRRALELLVSCRDGRTEAIMLPHGFSIGQMVELVRAGLATAQAERLRAGSLGPMEVTRVRITDAGVRRSRKGEFFIMMPRGDRDWDLIRVTTSTARCT
jgi:hypothetical protein